MKYLYEPPDSKAIRGDWCFDWVCPNQDCEEGNTDKNGYSNFVDGGGVKPGSVVLVECHECGTTQLISAQMTGGGIRDIDKPEIRNKKPG